MAFRKSDVFHVVDTLHNGVVGSWQVFRMGELAEVDLEENKILRRYETLQLFKYDYIQTAFFVFSKGLS